MSGNFVFQSFNKKILPFTSSYQNRVSTILTNPQQRGGNKGKTSKSVSSSTNSVMLKFIDTKNSPRAGKTGITKEDK